jgi:hypothetical protein
MDNNKLYKNTTDNDRVVSYLNNYSHLPLSKLPPEDLKPALLKAYSPTGGACLRTRR